MKNLKQHFLLAACILTLTTAAHAGTSSIERKIYHDMAPDFPETVEQITLTNNNGASAKLITYGAIVTNLMMPDKTGKMGDVVLGFDDLKAYQMAKPFMGCIAGRYANRIANGTFVLDGVTNHTTMNEGTNTLHGGFKGLAKRIWFADAGMAPDGPTVRFTILDPDGTEGFSGNLKVTVLYTLTQDNILKVQYYATTDKPTPINLTHHSYFNLSGAGKGDVRNYVAKINAPFYLPVGPTLIPTGEVAPVAGTPFDFTKAKHIGKDIASLPGTSPGYDHTMVFEAPKGTSGLGSTISNPAAANGSLVKAAEVYDPDSGRLLECFTTEPAVHFYITSTLNIAGKGGEMYTPYRAFCLETQHFPDSPNHPNFPSTILRPGETYRQLTEFKFTIPEKPLTPE